MNVCRLDDADLHASAHWKAKGTLLGQPIIWMVFIRCGVGGYHS